jgi:hypothetical protein
MVLNQLRLREIQGRVLVFLRKRFRDFHADYLSFDAWPHSNQGPVSSVVMHHFNVCFFNVFFSVQFLFDDE